MQAEAVSLAGDRRDKPWSPPVVLQLGPQASHVTVHDVALRYEINVPQGVEDLVASYHSSGICR